MQQSSETIGAIAAALAKAQADLTNPEKSLVATIRASNPARWIRRFVTRRCRAASRSRARPSAAMRSQSFKSRQSIKKRV